MNYSQKLKELRLKKQVTQEEIAKILNTSQSYYGQYERGNRPLPIEHLITLCKFYNVTADYILGLNDVMGD